jgi:predicted DsbA family dithiol-disulfide isomerase
VAAVRLQRVKEEYGDKLSFSWRSYPLLLGDKLEGGFTPRHTDAWHRAHLEESSLSFRPWGAGQPYPTSSLPALIASKCAERQGEPPFARFHVALFSAFFGECRNISDHEVLFDLAKELGLDMEKFRHDFDQGSLEDKVMAEFEEGRSQYTGWGVPLVIIGDRYPVVGAAPMAMYRRGIDLCLAKSTD